MIGHLIFVCFFCYQTDSEQVTPRMLAVDLDLYDCHGKTALHYATEKGQAFVAEQLISHGCRYDLRDRNGCAPLQYCLSGGHTLVAFVLLRHGHAIPQSECEVVQMIQLASLPKHSAVLHLLVYLGWRPHTIGLRELTAFLCRCVSSPADVVSWIGPKVIEPLTLSRISRLSAREHLARHVGHRSIVNYVNELNIQERVKQALLLDDVRVKWSFSEKLLLDEADITDGLVTMS